MRRAVRLMIDRIGHVEFGLQAPLKVDPLTELREALRPQQFTAPQRARATATNRFTHQERKRTMNRRHLLASLASSPHSRSARSPPTRKRSTTS